MADLWRPLVSQYLEPFGSDGGITLADVDRAEQWAANATAFSATGSFRAQIIDGALYVKMIRVHQHWAERTSVLRMLLLACCSPSSAKGPKHVDFVYGHADNDPTPAPRSCRWPDGRPRERRRGRPCIPTRRLPLFTNSHDRRSGGLPVPEFTWVGWGSAEPWCRQQKQFDEAARTTSWAARDRRLYFSGGLDNGHHRKALRALALGERSAGRHDELHIRDVGSNFHRWSQYDRVQPKATLQKILGNATTAVATQRWGKRREQALTLMTEQIGQTRVGPVAATHACGYQYAINVPGFGYSSRLRSLLRCGNAVVHVHHPSAEFFMPLLKHGEHLFIISGREPVRDALLPLLRSLHADPTRAGQVAAAGRRFASTYLSFDAVIGYLGALLNGYAEMRTRGDAHDAASARPPPTPSELLAQGYTHVATDDDLQRLSGMCDRCKDSGARSRPPPGCVVRPRLPACTLWAPRGGGRCFDTRCCKGFDCATTPLGCST